MTFRRPSPGYIFQEGVPPFAIALQGKGGGASQHVARPLVGLVGRRGLAAGSREAIALAPQ